jgi:hypothetical protein
MGRIINKHHPKFKLGDMVAFTTMGYIHFHDRVGKVVRIIPAGQRPTPEEFPDLYKPHRRPGHPRDHESYILAVQRVRSVKHFWPRVHYLRPIYVVGA